MTDKYKLLLIDSGTNAVVFSLDSAIIANKLREGMFDLRLDLIETHVYNSIVINNNIFDIEKKTYIYYSPKKRTIEYLEAENYDFVEDKYKQFNILHLRSLALEELIDRISMAINLTQRSFPDISQFLKFNETDDYKTTDFIKSEYNKEFSSISGISPSELSSSLIAEYNERKYKMLALLSYYIKYSNAINTCNTIKDINSILPFMRKEIEL